MKKIIFLIIFYPSLAFCDDTCNIPKYGHPTFILCEGEDGKTIVKRYPYSKAELKLQEELKIIDEQIEAQRAKIAYIQSVQNTARFLDDVENQRKLNRRKKHKK